MSQSKRQRWIYWALCLVFGGVFIYSGTSCQILPRTVVVREQLLENAKWKRFQVEELGVSYEAPDQRVRPGTVVSGWVVERHGCMSHSFFLNDAQIIAMYEQIDLIHISLCRFDKSNWERFLADDLPNNNYLQDYDDIPKFYPTLIMHKVFQYQPSDDIFFRRDFKCADGSVLSATANYKNLERDPERRRIHIATIKRIMNSIEAK